MKKEQKDLSLEAAQKLLKEAFNSNVAEASKEIEAILLKRGLALQVTPAQVILVPRGNK